MTVLGCIIALIVLVIQVQANTEKVIFTAPKSVPIPNAHPGLDDLCLESLTPLQHTLGTKLAVSFPTEERPRGNEHWYLLEGLKEGQRHEVRICWLASQPTDFWLDTFPLTEVFETPHLISSLASYAQHRQEDVCSGRKQHQDSLSIPKETASVLFLRIQSAANFYTTNKTLMDNPPPVDVDIILDPFLLNALPKSLLPTAAYIVVLAVASWFISGAIWNWLVGLTQHKSKKHHKD